MEYLDYCPWCDGECIREGVVCGGCKGSGWVKIEYEEPEQSQ